MRLGNPKRIFFMTYHLAQANAASMKAPYEAPQMQRMTSQIQEINQLAESSKGFLWRLTETNPDELRPIASYLGESSLPNVFFNMSLWTSVDALNQFTYRSSHRSLIKEKHDWIHPSKQASYVLWWVEEGRHPTITEACEKLTQLSTSGATPEAFDFKTPFPAPDRPDQP